LSQTDGNLSIVDTSGLSGQIKTTSTAAESISTAGGINAPGGITTGGINAGPITADTLKINSNVGFFGADPVGQQQNLLKLDENKNVFSDKYSDWQNPTGYEFVTKDTKHPGSAEHANRNFWIVASKIENIENVLATYGLVKK